MSFLSRLFARNSPRDRLRPLYAAIVAQARQPGWYAHAGVPDTIDGRFDMVAAILCLVLIRLEGDGEARAADSALLTELFVEDMDGQLREAGIGDVVVGKHMGRMMGALGGRLEAYRSALARPEGAEDAPFQAALVRNLYRGSPPSLEALAAAALGLRDQFETLAALPADQIVAGRITR